MAVFGELCVFYSGLLRSLDLLGSANDLRQPSQPRTLHHDGLKIFPHHKAWYVHSALFSRAVMFGARDDVFDRVYNTLLCLICRRDTWAQRRAQQCFTASEEGSCEESHSRYDRGQRCFNLVHWCPQLHANFQLGAEEASILVCYELCPHSARESRVGRQYLQKGTLYSHKLLMNAIVIVTRSCSAIHNYKSITSRWEHDIICVHVLHKFSFA